MAVTVKRYVRGQTRAIYGDAHRDLLCADGIPTRASRIEVVQEGPHRGRFFVDMSLLADAVGRDDFRVCLLPTYEQYAAANAAEVAWLLANWVLETKGDK